jgi:hypothetical protein
MLADRGRGQPILRTSRLNNGRVRARGTRQGRIIRKLFYPTAPINRLATFRLLAFQTSLPTALVAVPEYEEKYCFPVSQTVTMTDRGKGGKTYGTEQHSR